MTMSAATDRGSRAAVHETSGSTATRGVGRPRHYDDDDERELLLRSGYDALRDHGDKLTMSAILDVAGLSTRSFYRHFASKDALLCAMYRRDAELAAARIRDRLGDAASPDGAVAAWIDEIFAIVRVARRAERMAVLGSIARTSAEGAEVEVRHARELLVEPLAAAIQQGQATNRFRPGDTAADADLVAAVAMHAAGLTPLSAATTRHDQATVTAFCLAALSR